MKLWKLWIAFGLGLFAVSFILPVDKSLGSGAVPGWHALTAAFSGFVGPLGVLSALTNLVMLSAVLVFRTRRHGLVLALFVLCGVAVVINAFWLLDGSRGDLQVGYYLWWSSFAVMAAGLYGLHRRKMRYLGSPLGFSLS